MNYNSISGVSKEQPPRTPISPKKNPPTASGRSCARAGFGDHGGLWPSCIDAWWSRMVFKVDAKTWWVLKKRNKQQHISTWGFFFNDSCFDSPPVRWGLLDFMYAVLPLPLLPLPLLLLRPLLLRLLLLPSFAVLFARCRQISPDAKRDLQSAVGNAGPQ